MAEEHTSWCRLDECMAGVVATVDGDRIVGIAPDPENVMGRAGACPQVLASAGASRDPRRLLSPRKRVGDRWEDIPWEQALDEIAGRLKDIRKQAGPRALGLYAGAPVGTNTGGVARTLAVALGWSTPNLYSPLSTMGGPWVRAAELVLGHPVALQGDLGRAHYVVLLGANQDAQGWGPLQAGRVWGPELAHSRKTKSTKVVAVDPRKTPMAASADIHLPIRPGTELFLLLGMVRHVLDHDFRDVQYTDDYCNGLAALKEALAPWPLDRCAEICGVPAEDVRTVALKYARSAMGLVHKSAQALNNRHGTLTAWATLVLSALTANLLRPGGHYDNRGVLDVLPVVRKVPTDGAPRTRAGGFPLLLLQAPGAVLADEILTPGEGRLRALLSIQGDPARELPGGPRLQEALASLDLLVAMDLADNATTRLAHYVLPATHAWERADLHLHDTALLPWRTTQATEALVPPPGEARDEADVLAEIFRRVGPTLRGGVHGAHLRLLGSFVATADLAKWEKRLLDGSNVVDLDTLEDARHGWYGGDIDRATWRISTPSGKIELLPDAIAAELGRLEPPTAPAGYDLWLLTGAARDSALRPFDRPEPRDPGVTLHPSAGFPEGARVRVRTQAGAVEATVHLDPTLRPDTVDLPAGYEVDAMALLPTDALDPFVGTPAANGLPCRVESI